MINNLTPVCDFPLAFVVSMNSLLNSWLGMNHNNVNRKPSNSYDFANLSFQEFQPLYWKEHSFSSYIQRNDPALLSTIGCELGGLFLVVIVLKLCALLQKSK